MLALFPKIPKTERPKALIIDVFDYPAVVWRHHSTEHPRISTYTCITYITRNLSHLATSSPPIVWVYLHSNFLYRLRKTHVLCNGVRNGRSRSSKVTDFGTNRKRICNL